MLFSVTSFVACKWSVTLKPERKPACRGGWFSSRILVSPLVWIFEKSLYSLWSRVVLNRYVRDGTSSSLPSLRYSFNILSSPALFPCLSSNLALLTSLCRIEIFSPRGCITLLWSLCTFSWFYSRCVRIECCCLPYDLFPCSNFVIVSNCAASSVFQPSVLFLLLLVKCKSPWHSLQILFGILESSCFNWLVSSEWWLGMEWQSVCSVDLIYKWQPRVFRFLWARLITLSRRKW